MRATFGWSSPPARRERARRSRALPDGDYAAEDVIDGDGASDAPIAVQVVVRIRGDAIEADFTGSSPARRRRSTAADGALTSAVKTVCKALVGPQEPFERRLVPPADAHRARRNGVHRREAVAHRLVLRGRGAGHDLVWKALAPLAPERFSAGSYMSLCGTYIVRRRRRPATVRAYRAAERRLGRDAARDGASGADRDHRRRHLQLSRSSCWRRSSRCCVAPLRATTSRAASAPGSSRGGFGLVREYAIGCDEAVLYGSFGRNATPPWALAGGADGSTTRSRSSATASEHTADTPAALRRCAAATACASSPAAAAAWAIRCARDARGVAADVRAGCVDAVERRRRRLWRGARRCRRRRCRRDASRRRGRAMTLRSRPTPAAPSPISSPSMRRPARSRSARR